jgi:hypothetical protein
VRVAMGRGRIGVTEQRANQRQTRAS